jgi:hypothetical protein
MTVGVNLLQDLVVPNCSVVDLGSTATPVNFSGIVNFMYLLDWAIGYLDMWSNITLSVPVEDASG